MGNVGPYIVPDPVTVSPDMDVYAASNLILINQVSGVAVVDEDGKLLGMLSELDCLKAMVTSVYNGGDPGGALVRDIMTVKVESNHQDDDIMHVASSMLDHKHRRRPVLDDEGRLTGQITCRQILKAVTDYSDD